MSRRRGAILPLFAVSIVMLISAVGLALDGAYAAAAGRDLQSIADYRARVAATVPRSSVVTRRPQESSVRSTSRGRPLPWLGFASSGMRRRVRCGSAR